MFRKEDGAIDMVSLILTVVVACITIMIGIIIVSNMEISIGQASQFVTHSGNATNTTAGHKVFEGVYQTYAFGKSVLSTSFGNVLTNTGTAFNFLALGLFVLAAVFIIGIVAGVLGKSD